MHDVKDSSVCSRKLCSCRTISQTIVVALLFAGCLKDPGPDPKPPDNRHVRVEAGRGIPGICELGMTPRHFMQHDDQIRTHAMPERGAAKFALVPSLGAIVPIGERDQPISNISFYVAPYKALIPGLEVRHPFQGSIIAGPSFSKGPVMRESIFELYGRPQHQIIEAGDKHRLLLSGTSFRERGQDGEQFWYPAKGICFTVVSNAVVSFHVFRPQTNSAAATP